MLDGDEKVEARRISVLVDTQNFAYIKKQRATAVTAVNVYITPDFLQAMIVWREVVYGFFDTIPPKFSIFGMPMANTFSVILTGIVRMGRG